MNAKLYRHVFNQRLGCLVAVAEIAHSRLKGRGAGTTMAGRHPAVRPLSVAMGLIMGGSAYAQTLPSGGTIVGGQGQISTTGTTLTVQQNSARLAVNWNSFNIGAGDTVVFKQPSSSAVALNSVLGNNASEIYGALRANGQVFLINPDGVLFGKGAQVTVGGLFASTLPINTSAFMSSTGTYGLSQTGNTRGQVINQGNLKAVNGGFIVLAGNRVINAGTISATNGTVALAAGDSVTLDLDSAGRLTVNVTAATLGALIHNQGLIEADGGQVLLTARGLGLLQASVMNLSGVIQANSIGTRQGQIVIDGGDAAEGDSGMVSLVNATVNASGANTGEQGGMVTITGPHVNLQGSAINVSGNAGGGIALIGGDAHGAGSLTNALTTGVDPHTTIDASATGNGHGGTVVLWSDDETVFDGAVLARGGMLGGNGGSVESSSEGLLGVQGSVEATAAHGTAGSWLLDPVDITVSSAPDANYTPWFTPTGDPVTVNNTTLSNALQGGTSVTLDASLGTGGSGFINVTAPITSTGSGSLALLSANGLNVTLGANINLGSGSLTAVGGAGVNGTSSSENGTAGGSVIVDTGITLAAANVTLTGGAGGMGYSRSGVNGSNTAPAGVGGDGGTVVVSGVIAATNSVLLTGGAGGGGGGGSGSGAPCCQGGPGTGEAGAAGGAGGSVDLSANVSAGGVTMTLGNGGGGGGGGAGGGNGFAGGAGGAGGAAGVLNWADATVNATITTITGGDGGGGGGGGQQGTIYEPGGSGAGGSTGGAGGSGGLTDSVAIGGGSSGGAAGTSGGAGAAGVKAGGNGGSGGTGGAGSTAYVTSTTAEVTGGNVTFTTSATPIVLDANGTLTIDVTGSPTIANPISGPGNLTQAGAGETTLSGSDTFGGTLTISDGGVNMSGSWDPSSDVANVVMDNGTNFAAANITAPNTNINGTGSIELFGVKASGNVTAETASTTTVNGTLEAGAYLTLGGAIVSGGNLTLIAGANGASGLANGTDTAGDILLASGTTITAPATGTITIYQGNANTAALLAAMSGATATTDYKTYDATLAELSGTVAGTRNFYYRVQPDATVNATATKVYDGTTVAGAVANYTGATIIGIDGDSTVNVSGINESATVYNTSQAGTDLTLSGPFTGNMSYTSGGHVWEVSGYDTTITAGPSQNINITPASVIVTAATDTKVYDGTTLSNQSVTNITGLVSGDSLTGLTQAYNSSQVQGTNGSLLMVNSSDVGVSGSVGSTLSDYTITYDTTAGTITPASVIVTAATDSKAYDGTTLSNQSITNITGLVIGDSLAGLTQAYNSSQVQGANGSLLVVNSSGVGVSGSIGSTLSDYTIAYATTTGTITPASVIVTAATDTKVYDGTTLSNQSVTNITGLVSGDSLSGLTQAYNSSQVQGTNGSLLVVNSSGVGVNGGVGSTLGDYTITYVNTAGTITPRSLTIDLNNITKVYDGTSVAYADGGTAMASTSTTGLIAGDAITNVTGDGAYNSAHVLVADSANFALANLTVGLSGNDLSDYSVTLVQPVSATITPAPVTATAISGTKVYDGTTMSNVAVTNITGLVSGDSLTGLTQAYNSSQVQGTDGSLLIVNSSDVGVSGNHSSTLSDYTISYDTTQGTITPKPVTVTNVTLNSNDTLNISNAVISGVLPGQTLTVVPGSMPGTMTLEGPDAGDYVLTDPYAGSPPLVYVSQWLGTVYAAQHMVTDTVQNMATVLPPPWITVTQSPQSPQMLEVADTGQPATAGPTRIVGAGPSSNLYCVQGAIRAPTGVRALPMEDCDQPR